MSSGQKWLRLNRNAAFDRSVPNNAAGGRLTRVAQGLWPPRAARNSGISARGRWSFTSSGFGTLSDAFMAFCIDRGVLPSPCKLAREIAAPESETLSDAFMAFCITFGAIFACELGQEIAATESETLGPTAATKG